MTGARNTVWDTYTGLTISLTSATDEADKDDKKSDDDSSADTSDDDNFSLFDTPASCVCC